MENIDDLELLTKNYEKLEKNYPKYSTYIEDHNKYKKTSSKNKEVIKKYVANYLAIEWRISSLNQETNSEDNGFWDDMKFDRLEKPTAPTAPDFNPFTNTFKKVSPNEDIVVWANNWEIIFNNQKLEVKDGKFIFNGINWKISSDWNVEYNWNKANIKDIPWASYNKYLYKTAEEIEQKRKVLESVEKNSNVGLTKEQQELNKLTPEQGKIRSDVYDIFWYADLISKQVNKAIEDNRNLYTEYLNTWDASKLDLLVKKCSEWLPEKVVDWVSVENSCKSNFKANLDSTKAKQTRPEIIRQFNEAKNNNSLSNSFIILNEDSYNAITWGYNSECLNDMNMPRPIIRNSDNTEWKSSLYWTKVSLDKFKEGCFKN